MAIARCLLEGLPAVMTNSQLNLSTNRYKPLTEICLICIIINSHNNTNFKDINKFYLMINN